jgi:outer membrane protein assembly factor BamB
MARRRLVKRRREAMLLDQPLRYLVPTTMQKHTALVLTLVAAAVISADAQWTQFRGSDGTGLPPSGDPPVTWAEDKNVRWKTAIHGRAWSSPIILDGQVWVSTATKDGRELSALAVDLESGKILRDLLLFKVEHPQFAHAFNSYASPTPVIEPGRVYVTFGSPGTAAIDTKSGKVLWERRDLECNHFRGAGSSPILFGDLLIMHFDGSDQQYLVGLDKRTGRTVWLTKRSIDFKDLKPDGTIEADGDFRKAFSTPHVVMSGGDPVLVSIGSKATYGYDPRNGKELWRLEERGAHSGSTRPVPGHGLVFYPTGFPTGQLLAIRLNAVRDAMPEVVWKVTRGVPNKPSVLLVGDLIFMVNDVGIASCIEAKTGQIVWTSRVAGTYSASPIAAAGRVYFFNEDGKTTVIEAGREFKVISENFLEDGFMASPAVAGNALVLRTRTHLYRIEEAATPRL